MSISQVVLFSAFVLSLNACSGVDTSDLTNPFAGSSEAAALGAKLYEAQGCVTCHGADGAGSGDFPSIISAAQGDSDGEIFDIIQNGSGAMPAFDMLSDDEIWQIVTHLRTL